MKPRDREAVGESCAPPPDRSSPSAIRRAARHRDLRTAAALVLSAFAIYNANLRSVTSLDTYPTRLLPVSILREFDLDLDEFPFLQRYPDWYEGADRNGRGLALAHPYYVDVARGHVISHYPVMPAILAVPVYALPVWLGLVDGPPSKAGFTRVEIVATMLAKLSGSLAVALSVGVVYLTMRELVTRRGAFWVAFAYAFATSSWSVSSQGLWQSSMSQPLLALALYLLVRARARPRYAAWAGVPLALAVACRPTVAVIAVVLLAYVYRYHRAQLARFLVAPVVIGALLAGYNAYYFGTLLGGYGGFGGTSHFARLRGATGVGAVPQFTGPRLDRFAALLVSPSRGMLVLSPVLVFASAVMLTRALGRRDPLLRHVTVATVLSIVLFSTWPDWHGAFSYSYRYLVDLLPGMALGLGAAWPWIAARPARIALFAAAVAISVTVQIVGAFCFPCGWDTMPVSVRVRPERFWDWTDTEFARCLASGPVVPDGISALRELRGGGTFFQPASR